MFRTDLAATFAPAPSSTVADRSIFSRTRLSTGSFREPSHDGAVAVGDEVGWPLMLRRDQALIAGQDPRAVE